jgi:hypothetical protein
VAAKAVYWAAHHRRRELTVGGSALKAIWGNKLAPRFADWYLARTGFGAQQMEDLPIDGRDGNLFEPVENGAATHGMFDGRSRDRSLELWTATHRGLVAGALVGAAALAGGALRLSR